MTKAIVRSVLVAAVLAAGGMSAHAGQAAAGPQPTTSAALGETFTAAQKAMQARRWAEVTAKAKEVLAATRKTPDDVYAANFFLLEAAKAQRDTPGMISAMEAMLASGFNAGPAATNAFRKALMSAYYQQKNFRQAIKYGTELINAGAGDEDVYTVVGQSYYQTRDYGDAVKLFSTLVSNDEKAGRRPDRGQLILLQSSYDKAGNKEAAQATLEKVVRHYPDPKTWLALLYDLKREKLDPRQKIHLFRLMDSTGNLDQSTDYRDYSDSGMALGLWSEVARVLDKGIKAKAFTVKTDEERAARYRDSALKRVDEDKAELAKLTSEAKGAATGNEYVALGMTQISLEQYPQAIESLKAGIAKGGLKNAADAQMHLGYAQFKAGQKAEAVKTFRAVNGGSDDITQRLAKFWALHSGG